MKRWWDVDRAVQTRRVQKPEVDGKEGRCRRERRRISSSVGDARIKVLTIC